MTATERTDARDATPAGILRLGTPLLASNAAGIVAGLTDTAVMGWTTESGLAGVALASAVYAVVVGLPGSVAMGYQIMAARSLGVGDTAALARSYRAARELGLWVAVGTTIVLVAIGWPLMSVLIRSDDAAVTAGSVYLAVRAPAMVFSFVGQLHAGTFAAQKRTLRTMHYFVTTHGTNIALDVLLVLVLRWGAFGNGLATLVGAAVGNIVIMLAWRRSDIFAQVARRPEPGDMSGLGWEVVRLSGPLALAFILDYGAVLLAFALVGSEPVGELAAGRIAYTVMFALFAVFNSFSSATQILLGRNHPQTARDTHVAALRSGTVVLVIGGIVLGLALLIYPIAPVALMTDYADVRAAAGGMVRLVAVSLPLMGLCLVLVARFRASGATARDMQTNTIAVWAVQIPLTAALVALNVGVVSLFLGFLGYWISRLAALEIAARLDQRRLGQPAQVVVAP